MNRGKLLLWGLLGTISACGGVVPHKPQVLLQTQAANQDGRQALIRDDFLGAQQAFAKTLRLQQSLDDAAGMATSMINLATVEHKLRNDEAALAWLDKVLQDRMQLYPLDLHQIASFRRAVILTDLIRLCEAESAIQVAESLCGQDCPSRFGIAMLRARLLLLNGDAAGALVLALAVEQENGVVPEEKANALRVAGAAEEKLAHDESALQYYQDALELDKSMALSPRISQDLAGMARVSARLGRVQAAQEYARRAALVTDAYLQRRESKN